MVMLTVVVSLAEKAKSYRTTKKHTTEVTGHQLGNVALKKTIQQKYCFQSD